MTSGFALEDGGRVAGTAFAGGRAEVHGGVGLRIAATAFHLDEGPEMLWVNPYRLLARGRVLGYARTTPTTTFSVEDGVAVATWDPFEDHAATLEVRTRVVDERTIDTTFSVTAEAQLDDYEILVSSYYSPLHVSEFATKRVWFLDEDDDDGVVWFPKENRQLEPTTWPRDGAGARTLLDGRYDVGHPPLWWTFGSWYAEPLMVQRHKVVGHATATMASRADCFAIGGLTGYHNSQYFHLFGETLTPGTTRRATVRLVVLTGADDLHAAARAACAELNR